MENESNPESEILGLHPDQFIYKKIHLQLAAFFGGPLAIIYIIAENFRQLGYPQKIKKTWIIGIILSLAFIGFVIFMQLNLKTPSYLPSLISILIGTAIMQSWQGDDIKGHTDHGGPVYPLWRALLIGMISLVITIVFLVGLLLILQQAFGLKFAE